MRGGVLVRAPAQLSTLWSAQHPAYSLPVDLPVPGRREAVGGTWIPGQNLQLLRLLNFWPKACGSPLTCPRKIVVVGGTQGPDQHTRPMACPILARLRRLVRTLGRAGQSLPAHPPVPGAVGATQGPGQHTFPMVCPDLAGTQAPGQNTWPRRSEPAGPPICPRKMWSCGWDVGSWSEPTTATPSQLLAYSLPADSPVPGRRVAVGGTQGPGLLQRGAQRGCPAFAGSCR